MISMPPMVGVPAFEACEEGPSSLIDSPYFMRRNIRIKGGPMKYMMIRAVSAAATVRKVTYPNMRKNEISFFSG